MFRKVNNWIHLWLGLISGVIMLIVCLTGAIWTFGDEIKFAIYGSVPISKGAKAVVLPSVIKQVIQHKYPGQPINTVFYKTALPIEVIVKKWGDNPLLLHLDPFTGKILRERLLEDRTTLFFYWIEGGHRNLWLPGWIGRPVANYGTLMFVVLLITGLVWWYPKKWNKSTSDKSFKIKWGAKWKRVNLDLHNVLGFYVMLIALILSLTGMVYGIKWYSRGVYKVTTGVQLPDWSPPLSDTTKVNNRLSLDHVLDRVLVKTMKRYPDAQGFFYRMPDSTVLKSAIDIEIYPDLKSTYKNANVCFDRHTLAEIQRPAHYATAYKDSAAGLKLRRMNYDLHVGQILGLPGKIIAFFACLIGASLPVTGFIIWYNRKFGKKKKKR